MSIDKKKVNVLHFISTFTKGGAEKLLLYFVKACNEDVIVAIMSDEVDDNFMQELIDTGTKVHVLNKKQGQKHPKFLFRLLKVIKEHNVDIVHSHDGCVKWAILCKMLKPQLKLVYTIHSSIYIKNWGFIKRFVNRTFIDMTIAISDGMFNDCVKQKLKTLKIYNGIDTKRWKQPQVNERTFSIINVGRLSCDGDITYQIKGQDILIKALKECKDRGLKFTCNFVGGDDDAVNNSSLKYLKKINADLGLSEEIQFLGNREDIPDLLAQSDIFILPSRYEGMPIALLEAMAAKVPVIASNISGSTDLVEHGKNGLLFESENYHDLAEKIIYLYHHRDEMKHLSQNAFEYVQDFDISMMVNKTWDLYKRLMK